VITLVTSTPLITKLDFSSPDWEAWLICFTVTGTTPNELRLYSQTKKFLQKKKGMELSGQNFDNYTILWEEKKNHSLT
jgi:hypothetical protein